MILFDLHANRAMWWLPLQLLWEREPHENISHRTMPTVGEHIAFVASHPYKAWYWFEDESLTPAGCAYITHQGEIGIGVLRAFRGRGLATEAIQEIMRRHPGRHLANINPANEASIRLFRKLGFGGPIQITLEHGQ